MAEVEVILPDGRQIVAQIPDGTANPREFVIDELTQRGLLGLPPLTAEQQQVIGAVPPTPLDPLAGTFARAAGVEPTVPPTPGVLGAAAGIAPGGAEISARARAGFAADPSEGARITLEQQFGQPVTIGQRPEIGGRITFINPETGQEEFFNPPGFDPADIGAIPGAAAVAVPEVVGGVAGALAGGAPGGIAGAGLGAGIGEAIRLEIGRALDVNPDLTAREQAIMAATEAGQAAAIDALTFGVGTGVRRLLRGAPTPTAPAGVLEEFGGPALEEGLTAGRRLQAEFSESFGTDLPLNTEQVLRDVAAVQSRELRGATEAIRARPPGEQLRAQRRQQFEAVEQAAEQVLGPEGVPTAVAGRQLQQVARQAPQAAIAEQRRQLQAFDVGLQRQEQLTTVQAIDAGAAIRATLEGERDALETRFDARYDQLRAATGDTQVSLAPIALTARRSLKQLDEDIFASLAPENRTVIEDAIGASEGVASFEVVQRALSDLRAERRLIRKNLSPRRNIGQIESLIESLEIARGAALRGRPDIALDMVNLEADFAAAKGRIDRGLVGRLLQPAEGGGFRLADDRVIPTILRSPDLARKMADVFSDPTFQFQPGARLEIQQGLLSAMREAALDPKTGRMTAKRFKDFRNKNQTVLNAFFDEETNKTLSTLSGTLGESERLTTRLTRITDDLNRTFGMNLQKLDPTQVMNRVFSGRARDIPENLRRARIIAKRDPVVFEEFQKATLAQLRRASTRATSQEPGRLDFTSLVGLSQNKEIVEELTRIMGPRWRRGFEVFTEALDTTRMRPTDAAAIQAMQAAGEPGSVVQGLLRVTFPPLTREGRALTGLLRTNRESTIRSLDNILANPEIMVQLTQVRATKNRRAAFRMLEAIGLGHIAIALEDQNGG